MFHFYFVHYKGTLCGLFTGKFLWGCMSSRGVTGSHSMRVTCPLTKQYSWPLPGLRQSGQTDSSTTWISNTPRQCPKHCPSFSQLPYRCALRLLLPFSKLWKPRGGNKILAQTLTHTPMLLYLGSHLATTWTYCMYNPGVTSTGLLLRSNAQTSAHTHTHTNAYSHKSHISHTTPRS